MNKLLVLVMLLTGILGTDELSPSDRLSAVPMCVEYNYNGECIRCQERYYLQPPPPKSISEHASCKPCIEGCLKCRDDHLCQECDLRHTQRPGNSTCELCDPSCNTCGSEPDFCTSCPKFSSLDKARGKCTWTFRIIIGVLAVVAIILLITVVVFSCQSPKPKRKSRKQTNLTDNILDDYSRIDKTNNDKTQAQLITTLNMIGVGNNETNLSEVDKQTEEPYSNTDDLGMLVKNTLKSGRYK